MKDRSNFELLNREDSRRKAEEEVKAVRPEKTSLDVEASEGELLWTCSLILIAYAGIGVILTGKLILDTLDYFGWTI
ncbi:hypothetical protein PM10SUCC1_10060 [Propionigenium maris DSM 9537]|uniref:Uncharacterized protein n=1 Tax=Propionigenium maris DSM 9537 TaxID=1123000 RepID=A0A9W6GJX2_9FUSO|nr:hypothetical protein [Propionigenium maris]GLI55492.1 hypothetical protein PM10SUCC1_10060 [Propionigenium maris DSM 9537]